jgi:hypothetical protein
VSFDDVFLQNSKLIITGKKKQSSRNYNKEVYSRDEIRAVNGLKPMILK